MSIGLKRQEAESCHCSVFQLTLNKWKRYRNSTAFWWKAGITTEWTGSRTATRVLTSSRPLFLNKSRTWTTKVYTCLYGALAKVCWTWLSAVRQTKTLFQRIMRQESRHHFTSPRTQRWPSCSARWASTARTSLRMTSHTTIKSTDCTPTSSRPISNLRLCSLQQPTATTSSTNRSCQQWRARTTPFSEFPSTQRSQVKVLTKSLRTSTSLSFLWIRLGWTITGLPVQQRNLCMTFRTINCLRLRTKGLSMHSMEVTFDFIFYSYFWNILRGFGV